MTRLAVKLQYHVGEAMTRFWKNARHWQSVHLTETSRIQGVGPRESVVVANITRYMLWAL